MHTIHTNRKNLKNKAAKSRIEFYSRGPRPANDEVAIEMTPEEWGQMKEAIKGIPEKLKTINDLKAELASMKEKLEADDDETVTKAGETLDKIKTLTDQLTDLDNRFKQSSAMAGGIPGVGGDPKPFKSIGARFLDDPGIKGVAIANGAKATFNNEDISLYEEWRKNRKSAESGIDAASLTALQSISILQRQDIISAPERQMVLRNLFTNFPTTSDRIDWVEETEFNHLYTKLSVLANSGVLSITVANGNGITPGSVCWIGATGDPDWEKVTVSSAVDAITFEQEDGVDVDSAVIKLAAATTQSHAKGASFTSNTFNFTAKTKLKPNASAKWEAKSTTVKTLAHGIPLPKQTLEDHAQLRMKIDTRLLEGLQLAEEWQIIYGDGVGENLTGVVNTTGVQTYKWSDGEAKDGKQDAMRRAMTLAWLSNYMVDGFVINPLDLEDIELDKDDNGRYRVILSVNDAGLTRIWRVPLHITTAITAGTCIVGAFRLGGVFYDRKKSSIEIATQHEDHFMRNMVQLRAEERVGFVIERPDAFVVITFDEEPGGGST